MRAMIDKSPDGIKLHVIAHDGRESRIMDDSEGIIDVAIVSDKTGPMIATKPDGSTWVSYEDYIVITAENKRLQAEVEWYSNLMKKGNDELERMTRRCFVEKENVKSMTARCKAAEEERDSYMFLLKGLLECGDCKICEDGRAEIDDLFKAWLTLKNKEVGK